MMRKRREDNDDDPFTTIAIRRSQRKAIDELGRPYEPVWATLARNGIPVRRSRR